MSVGRKIVKGIEKGLTKGVRAGKSFWREVAEALDEAPKAFDRFGDAVSEVIEHADEGATEEPSRPSLSDPCTSNGGKHSVYSGGPGGKRDSSQAGLVCQSCGAFEPEPKVDAK